MSELSWFKSSFSEAAGNACVEVALCEEGVAVRDSVHPQQVIKISRPAFDAFIADVRAGVLDDLPD